MHIEVKKIDKNNDLLDEIEKFNEELQSLLIPIDISDKPFKYLKIFKYRIRYGKETNKAVKKRKNRLHPNKKFYDKRYNEVVGYRLKPRMKEDRYLNRIEVKK